MKKATHEQIERSLKKLARAMARWNYLEQNETPQVRSRKTCELLNAAWRLVQKAGHYPEYKKEMDKRCRK